MDVEKLEPRSEDSGEGSFEANSLWGVETRGVGPVVRTERELRVELSVDGLGAGEGERLDMGVWVSREGRGGVSKQSTRTVPIQIS